MCTEAKKVVVNKSCEKLTKSKIEGSSTRKCQSCQLFRGKEKQEEDRVQQEEPFLGDSYVQTLVSILRVKTHSQCRKRVEEGEVLR